jgi:hypothetical protein
LIEQILLSSSFGRQRLKEIARRPIRVHQCQLARKERPSLLMGPFHLMRLRPLEHRRPSFILDDGRLLLFSCYLTEFAVKQGF